MTAKWTIYTAKGNNIVANTWNELGDKTEDKLIASFDDADHAAAEAQRMQEDYNKVRRTADVSLEIA